LGKGNKELKTGCPLFDLLADFNDNGYASTFDIYVAQSYLLGINQNLWPNDPVAKAALFGQISTNWGPMDNNFGLSNTDLLVARNFLLGYYTCIN